MLIKAEKLQSQATQIQQRERKLNAKRGEILDRNGVVLATSESVYNIWVIHNQIEDQEGVIAMLTKELAMSKETVKERVKKVSSIEKIKSNVKKEVGEKILSYGFKGVICDPGYKRIYPYGNLASKVLGFAGGDNQGILGLEAKYEEYLAGSDGIIYTTTDARGREVVDEPKLWEEPTAGETLMTTLDVTMQSYAMQAAEKTYVQKEADGVEILVMNPKNGEIYAMVDYPEYDLNQPFCMENTNFSDVNQMWRNWCVSDTYEPGSIFKIVTASIALENNLVSLEESFYCPGYTVVEDRKIHCHKTSGHGSETFTTGIYNSCNPVFINVGLRIGPSLFYDSMQSYGLLDKTGIDLPGEAKTIMHKPDKIGEVELATVSFGQSFQISPIMLATTISSIINGGTKITPHVGMGIVGKENFTYPAGERVIGEETSQTMRSLLQGVVEEGGGSKAYLEGYEIGGKTATSQTFPRSDHKYISAFCGFYPAKNPKMLILVIIRNPKGLYYGGTIAAPVAREIMENLLPYLDK